LVEQAVAKALGGGARTGDIAPAGAARLSTTEMGDRVLGELQKLA
jgi:3-isopropylmalate dehydrogenase